MALAALGALALSVGVQLARGGSPIALDPIWDDGKAEFSTYSGTTQAYGKPRATRARIVVVKEDLVARRWSRATQVRCRAGRSRRSR